MQPCSICKGQAFEVADGFYYCSECFLRSPELRLERLEFNKFYGVGRSRKINIPKPAWKNFDLSNEEWTTTEAFNIILHEQCQALVSLGVDPELKDVVLQLWIKYLKKCEVAFVVSHTETWVPKLPSKPSKRDVQIFQKQPVRNRSMIWKGDNFVKMDYVQRAKKQPLIKPLIVRRRTKTVPKAVAALKICENTSESFSSVAINTFNKWRDQKLDLKKGLEKRMYKSMDSMTLIKVFSFVLLGLRLIGSPVLVSDVARWIREGSIPFMEAYKLFPSNWNLLLGDRTKFRESSYPNLQHLCSNMVWMAKFLDIRDPGLTSLKEVACRIFGDLNLPYHCFAVLCSVVEKIEYRKTKCLAKTYFVPLEMNAAICIIITLKLVFGLDGTSERKLSEIAKKKNKSTDGGFFVWTDWERQTEMLLQHLETSCPSSYLFSLQNSLDLDALWMYIHETDFGKIKGVRFKKTISTNGPKQIDYAISNLKKTYTFFGQSQVLEDNRPRSSSSFPFSQIAWYFSNKVGFALKDFSMMLLQIPADQTYWLWPQRLKPAPPTVSKSFKLLCKVLSAILHTDILETSYSELGSLERFFMGLSRGKGRPRFKEEGYVRKKVRGKRKMKPCTEPLKRKKKLL